MAETLDIISAADVTARLSTQAYTRLYARNGGATVDTVFRDLCVAEANSLFRTLSRGAFPSGVYLTGDTIDPAIVGAVVDLCNDIAASRHLSYDAESGYAMKAAQARALIKAMNRDADARPPGSSTAPAQSRASIVGTTTAAGAPTDPYGRAASGRDGTGF